MTVHMLIPDLQAKPGVPLDNCRWIGRYILERKPDVIVNIGDTGDMPSLSSYDKGKIQFEGRRYKEDIRATNEAFRLLDRPTIDYNRRRTGNARYTPRKIYTLGNHEARILRCIEDNPILEGTIGLEDIQSPGWERHPFREVVTVDGVSYSHFFYNPMTGKPYGGQVATRLKTIGHSFTMGHQQTLDYALRFVRGRSQHGLVCGSAYLHSEDYLGPQGNSHWRGIVVKHQVEDGSYDPMFVSLDYLCRRYEGVSLSEFLQGKYPEQTGELWGR